MKAGRKPTPASLKILRGNAGKRRIAEEPSYPEGWPEMPSWLDERGREEWLYVASQIQASGVVRLIDRTLLAAYCDAVSRAVRASAAARKYPEWIAKANQSWTVARQFGAVFGIGPAERQRVTVPVKSNPKARFFSAGARG